MFVNCATVGAVTPSRECRLPHGVHGVQRASDDGRPRQTYGTVGKVRLPTPGDYPRLPIPSDYPRQYNSPMRASVALCFYHLNHPCYRFLFQTGTKSRVSPNIQHWSLLCLIYCIDQSLLFSTETI